MLLATLLLPLGAPHTTYSHLTNAHPPSAPARPPSAAAQPDHQHHTYASPKHLGHKFDYNWTAGFIGSGGDVEPLDVMSSALPAALALALLAG